METSVNKIKNLPLRKYLVFSVLITLAIIVLLSSATILGCMTFRKYLLPESNNVFLTVDETYADGTDVSYSMRIKVGEEGAELPVLMSEDGTAEVSIAHDLRNPIAVIEGYTEYLQMNLAKGNLSHQRILKIGENLNLAAKRLERYTESVRILNQLEDMEINRQKAEAEEFVSDMEDDLQIMAQKSKIRLTMDIVFENAEIWVDPSVLYRVLEMFLAMRFAMQKSV